MELKETSKPLFGADNNALVALVSVNLMVAVTYGMTRMVYFLEGFPTVTREQVISLLAEFEKELIDRVA